MLFHFDINAIPCTMHKFQGWSTSNSPLNISLRAITATPAPISSYLPWPVSFTGTEISKDSSLSALPLSFPFTQSCS